jgi:hypothetical protein
LKPATLLRFHGGLKIEGIWFLRRPHVLRAARVMDPAASTRGPGLKDNNENILAVGGELLIPSFAAFSFLAKRQLHRGN